MTSADDLNKICQSVNAFKQELKSFVARDPVTYDSQLNIPNWQQTGIESFANNTQANAVRFLAHVALLNDNQFPETNKTILNNLARELQEAAQLCQAKTPPHPAFNRLISDLNTLNDVLKNYSPPRGPAPSSPPRP
jgi:hypothetical protein